MIKRQIELMIESISYHQLYLQKLHEQQTDKNIKEQILYKHEELCEISKMLIKELDGYENNNF